MTGLKDFQRHRQGLGLTSQRSRDRLVERLRNEGIADLRVLAALSQVPRHVFVDEALSSRAYEDTALPIGLGQTISQPFVVARMTELILGAGRPVQRALEVGTGSGYQAAVLAALVQQVYTVERIDDLLRQARRRFRRLGLERIRSRHADGGVGWPEEAPFDAIIVTAGAPALSPDLFDQLAPGGVLVAPVGQGGEQRLMRWTLGESGLAQEAFERVVFVPLLSGVE